MIDMSPAGHAVVALIIQCISGFLFDMWGVGGALGSLWFIAREQTQAEYRWIATFGGGKRSAMPWWGGFDYRAWNLGSVLDWVVPVIVCTGFYFIIMGIE